MNQPTATTRTDRPTHRDCGGRIRPAAFGYPATCDACDAGPVSAANIDQPTECPYQICAGVGHLDHHAKCHDKAAAENERATARDWTAGEPTAYQEHQREYPDTAATEERKQPA